MTDNWFAIEQMMHHRQQDLLKEAADMRRALAVRHPLDGHPVRPGSGDTLAARLGRALETMGRRLQGMPAPRQRAPGAAPSSLDGTLASKTALLS